VVPAQQDIDGARHSNVTSSTPGTQQGSILAGKRPIASPFPDIPVTQASADAEASATERAPDTACSAGELVTAHAPSLGAKLKSLCSVSRKGLHTVSACLQNRQSSRRAQQQQQHATELLSSSY